MKVYATLAALILSGCVNTPVAQISDMDICRYVLRGGSDGMIAQNEASRRGLDCRPLYGVIMGQQQQQAQALDAAARMFAPPPPAPMQFPTTCRSRRVGNDVVTDCR